MPNTREKLIELLEEIACRTDDERCQKCEEQDCVRCAYENVADHLIANGVTVQDSKVVEIDHVTDTNVGEFERLSKEVDRLSQCVLYHDGHIADAIKEFVERLRIDLLKTPMDYYYVERQIGITAENFIANCVTVQKWIPVTERLPEDNSDVLAYMQNSIESRIFPASYHKGWWEDCIWNTRCLSVTHWMPLPEPPKED